MQRLCDVCHGVYANNSSFSGTTYYPQNTWCREENGHGIIRSHSLGVATLPGAMLRSREGSDPKSPNMLPAAL